MVSCPDDWTNLSYVLLTFNHCGLTFQQTGILITVSVVFITLRRLEALQKSKHHAAHTQALDGTVPYLAPFGYRYAVSVCSLHVTKYRYFYSLPLYTVNSIVYRGSYRISNIDSSLRCMFSFHIILLLHIRGGVFWFWYFVICNVFYIYGVVSGCNCDIAWKFTLLRPRISMEFFAQIETCCYTWHGGRGVCPKTAEHHRTPQNAIEKTAGHPKE